MILPAGVVSPEDRELLARASSFGEFRTLEDCSRGSLLEICRTHDPGFAAAMLCDRILRHPGHGTFTSEILQGTPPRHEPAMVAIVPGAFYRQHRNTGADGARVIQIAKKLGCETAIVPVESFGPLKTNAEIIRDWLMRNSSRRTVLVSLSKGSADLKVALAVPEARECFANVIAWISLSGLSHGTPLAAWLRPQRLRRIGVGLWLWWHGSRYSVVEELRSDEDGPLAAWPRMPAHLKLIHVIGFPLRRHLAHPWAHRGWERAAPWGPNDGGGLLLADAAKLPGVVFPVWGADHYLEPAWDAAPLLQQVLASAMTPDESRQANQSATHPSNPPAIRSTA